MEQEIKTEEKKPELGNDELSPKELKELMEKNLELTKEIHEMTHKIKSYITFQKILSFIYLFLIVMPIILGALFLPPIFKNLFSQYSELMNPGSGSLNIGDFFKQELEKTTE
ncbi:MAG: hypothetical protein UT48_C0010G0028 [Parcubacteria group bacterium GW2011_GWE2_39_37]|uniref:Uncharacterized protein n=1 Tax=Candidatus Falkowbacteria bacterium GW2011_GWF2_39_8 TaxID=1618642 RepID=A0A0G0PUA6_9BACT|nr:MAG: hypothetical protein UT48_C0010G0028 [Parcubacteria group bacterium GW2011_GWE2_39_37]KKR31508.1 MAG: hypothetical protein UT64_C0058G0001 [Candidatus Falkowbacteria bacterium GW2011_GWF2_39_8]